MYKALIDSQSITNLRVLNDYEMVGGYDERWPGEEYEKLHILKLKIKDNEVVDFLSKLSNNWLKKGWFGIVWNDEKVSVVFKGKIFELRNTIPWNKKEFSKMVEYGEKHEVAKKYFDKLRKVVDEW